MRRSTAPHPRRMVGWVAVGAMLAAAMLAPGGAAAVDGLQQGNGCVVAAQSGPPDSAPPCDPSFVPSNPPSEPPSFAPSDAPSFVPTDAPSFVPTNPPSEPPTAPPTTAPTEPPTTPPTTPPTDPPTTPPTTAPTEPPTTAPTTEPSQDVLSETDTPNVTLPPTDGVDGGNGESGTAIWRLLFLGMAAGLAAVLVLAPQRGRRRS